MDLISICIHLDYSYLSFFSVCFKVNNKINVCGARIYLVQISCDKHKNSAQLVCGASDSICVAYPCVFRTFLLSAGAQKSKAIFRQFVHFSAEIIYFLLLFWLAANNSLTIIIYQCHSHKHNLLLSLFTTALTLPVKRQEKKNNASEI